MNEIQVFRLSLKDFFTKDILKIAIFPLLFTIFVMFFFFFILADIGYANLQEFIQTAQNGEEIVLADDAPFYLIASTYILVFLFKYTFTSWLIGIIFYTLGTIFIMMFSVFLSILIIGFFTPMILSIIHKRHYSSLVINSYGTFLSSIWVLVKSFLFMILFFILLSPLYFIPLINILAINLPFYYFFHKLLTFDVYSNIFSKEEKNIIHGKYANIFRLRTLFLYIISMIPFITMFCAVFYIVYLGHSYFLKLKLLRKVNLYENLKEIEVKVIKKTP